MLNSKSCFVIIGFGPKTDFETGRVIDLDKTFENLIKPVFDDLNINCFRAKDIRHTGNIDVPMYEWIYKADLVVADVSTLNPNALYELGVRHALRPNTTIVISENQTKYPFDLNHTLIATYEHLGKDIGVSEATRFKDELKKTVIDVLKTARKDSPVYTFLPDLIPPKIYQQIENVIDTPKIDPTLSELIDNAEDAKNKMEYWVAGQLYKVCLKFEPQNIFLRQRLALVTYKLEKPTPQKALLDAEKIIKELKPEETTDGETIGLSGAVNKRLYEITKNEKRLDKALWFYSKGFYISQDHYNGINLAFLLTLKATLQRDPQKAISFFLQSQAIREEIIKICLSLIKAGNFNERDDKQWIFQSLAQAYLGLGNLGGFEKTITKIKKLSKGKFDLDTFHMQNKKLQENIELFRNNSGYKN